MNKRAVFGVSIAYVAFGFTFLLTKIALSQTETFMVLAVRFLIAASTLHLLRLLGVIHIHLKGKRKRTLLLMGLTQPCLYFICEIYGLEYTTSSFAGIFIALIPLASMILSALVLKEAPTRTQVIFILISLCGTVALSCLSNVTGAVSLVGVVFLIGAVSTGSVFNIFSRKASVEFSPAERTYVMFLMGGVFFLVCALFQFRGWFLPEFFRVIRTPAFILPVVCLALSSVFTFFLINYGLSCLSITVTSSLSNITTVISIVLGVVVLNEPFSILHFIFCVLVFVGILGVNAHGHGGHADKEESVPDSPVNEH